MKDLTAIAQVMNIKTGANVSKENIITVYDGKDFKIFAAHVTEMSILSKVYPDGSFKVNTVVW